MSSITFVLAAAAARVSRRLQDRTGHHHHHSPRHPRHATGAAHVPLSDQFLAISGVFPPARSAGPPPKRQRAATAVGGLRGGCEPAAGLVAPAVHGVPAATQAAGEGEVARQATPRQTAAARKGEGRGMPRPDGGET